MKKMDFAIKTSLIQILLICVLLGGCQGEKIEKEHQEPTLEDVNLAFTKAIDTLNREIGAEISSISYEWIEVPSDCYGHIDYFAEQVIWAFIFQKEAIKKRALYIDCSIAEQYEPSAKI